nr:MAG TPA: hypothetical protein [Caudoviricetes sp.]
MKETKIIVEIVNNKPNYDKVKHLEFIENIVKRMADNSLSMKKFCLTIFVALMAININKVSISVTIQKQIGVLLVLSTVIFALLDAYYLCLEKLYRKLYQNVDEGDYTKYELDVEENLKVFFRAVLSPSVFLFYLSIIALIIIINTDILECLNN